MWRDKATGVEYRQAHGCPLFGTGTDATRFMSAFFIQGGRIVYLERTDVAAGTFVRHGDFYGAEVVNGRIVKETK